MKHLNVNTQQNKRRNSNFSCVLETRGSSLGDHVEDLCEWDWVLTSGGGSRNRDYLSQSLNDRMRNCIRKRSSEVESPAQGEGVWPFNCSTRAREDVRRHQIYQSGHGIWEASSSWLWKVWKLVEILKKPLYTRPSFWPLHWQLNWYLPRRCGFVVVCNELRVWRDIAEYTQMWKWNNHENSLKTKSFDKHH